jgi:zinc transport system substrate-binding protein
MPVTLTKKRVVLCFGLGLLLKQMTIVANEQPKVLSSIRPLALVVESLAGDLVKSEALLSGGESPHHLALKMSQMEKIKRADLVIWVGPELERFLVKPLQKHPAQIAMSKINGIYWLYGSVGHEHGRTSDTIQGDPHIWLDLNNVELLSARVASELTRLLPAHKSLIESRKLDFVRDLTSLNERTHAELSQLTGGFISYHQALDYYVSTYKLNHIAAVLEGSDERPGAKHIAELKNARAKEAHCLVADLSETESAKRYAALLALPLVSADVLAQDAKIVTWFDYYKSFAEVFKSCMQKRG